jgi:hypothetical protein
MFDEEPTAVERLYADPIGYGGKQARNLARGMGRALLNLPADVGALAATATGNFGAGQRAAAEWRRRVTDQLLAPEGGTAEFVGELVGPPTKLAAKGAAAAPALAGIFIGEKAKTFPRHLVAKVLEMEKAGAPREEVYAATGLWRGPEGKLRFEIDDSQARFNVGGGVEQAIDETHVGDFDYGPTFGTRGALLEHPDLAAAYNPADIAASTRITRGSPMGGRGAFSPVDKEITLAAPANVPSAKSTTLHEIQHGIQVHEGFPTGGSSGVAGWVSQTTSPHYRKLAAELMRSPEFSQPVTLEKYWGGAPSPEDMGRAQEMYQNYVLDFYSPKTQDALWRAAMDRAGSEGYRRLAGEAEARAVQLRMNMTPEERMATPPWKSFDVPEDKLIVTGVSADPAQSVGPLPFARTTLEEQAVPSYKSKERLTMMSPDDFLTMAERLEQPDPTKMARVSAMLQRGDDFDSVPYLYFDLAGDTATVTGHEGRHRALALRERGVEQMPVSLRGPIRWSEQGNPEAFDYVTEWPTTLVGQGRADRLSFPVRREQAGAADALLARLLMGE